MRDLLGWSSPRPYAGHKEEDGIKVKIPTLLFSWLGGEGQAGPLLRDEGFRLAPQVQGPYRGCTGPGPILGKADFRLAQF